jgi:hypothetical protein
MRAISRLLVLAIPVVAILFVGAPATADVEKFRLQWASYETFIAPMWSNATTTVSLEPWTAPDGSGTGYHLFGPTGTQTGRTQFDFFFLCVSGNPEQCRVASAFSPYQGSLLVQRNYPGPGDANLTLDIDLSQPHVSGHLIGVGTKEQELPPPPSPVKVFITQPLGGATVSGTVWVVLWAEGTSGTSNTFTLSADGKQVRTQTTSARGPVTIPWPTTPVGTTPVANGTHTLTGTVRDATGNTGTTSITVILKN